MVRSEGLGCRDTAADRPGGCDFGSSEEDLGGAGEPQESSLEYYERLSRSSSHFGRVYSGLYPVGPRLASFTSSGKRSRFPSTYNEDDFSSSSSSVGAGSLVGSDDKMYIDFPIRNFWKVAKTPIDMESPQIGYCRGFYYRLLVHPRGGACNDSESSYLSVFLEALYHESYPDDWIFPNVRFQLSVVNFLDPKANITSWAHWTFSHDAMSRGWHKMVSHVRLTKAAGFVDEDGTVLIRGRAEPPFPRIWSRSPKCRPWSVWGTLPYRNASSLVQYRPCISSPQSEPGTRFRGPGSVTTNLCPFHELAESSNRGSFSNAASRDSSSSSPVHQTHNEHRHLDPSLLVGSTPLSIMDRLLWSSSNLFVPSLRPQLNLDFVPAFVHLLYHIKEFRRAVFSWSPPFPRWRPASPGRPPSLRRAPEASPPQASIIEALQKTFAYMTLWPIAYSVKRSIRHGWQERVATDPTLVDGWCFSKCCKCGGEFESESAGAGGGPGPEAAPAAEQEECPRCRLPPVPDCSLIMKALFMNDLQRIDVSDPLMRFHCFIFGAIYLESAHAILQIAAHHR
ncbi:RNA pseudouridine synthase superfamily protein, partial [Cryptosporidium felis]